VFEWPTVGQVKPGYDADLLVLDADPTRDIGNLKRIRHLILAGDVIDRDGLLRAGARR
jgi:imidazolonepropionase-like amidohydrolase